MNHETALPPASPAPAAETPHPPPPRSWLQRVGDASYRLFAATPTKFVGTGYSLGDILEAMAGFANRDAQGNPNHDKIASAAIGGLQSVGFIADRIAPDTLDEERSLAIVEHLGENLIGVTVAEDRTVSAQWKTTPLGDAAQNVQDYAPAMGSASMVYSGWRKIKGSHRDYGVNIGEFGNGALNMAGFGLMAVDKLYRRGRQKEKIQLRPEDALSVEQAEAARHDIKPYNPMDDVKRFKNLLSGLAGGRKGETPSAPATDTDAQTDTPSVKDLDHGKVFGLIPERYFSKVAAVILAGTSVAGVVSGVQDIVKGGRNRLVGFIQLMASSVYMLSEGFLHFSSQYDADRRILRTRILPSLNHRLFSGRKDDGPSLYDRLLDTVSAKTRWDFDSHSPEQNQQLLRAVGAELASLSGETPKYADCYLYQEDIVQGLEEALLHRRSQGEQQRAAAHAAEQPSPAA